MTLQREYFARLYAASDDPWRFRERWYEQRKRPLTLAALPKPRYASAFEPDAPLASSLQDCQSARQRLRHLRHVRVEQHLVPREWPEASFELIVISELAYYFDDAELTTLIARASSSLTPGGTLLACHWRHPVAEYPQTGDAVHSAFSSGLSLRRVLHHEEEDFLLDVWSDDERSVARIEGLV